MTPGRLNRFVLVRKWADVPDALQDVTQQFDKGVERWAALQPVSGAMYWGAQQAQTDNKVTHRVWFRWSPEWNEANLTGEHVIEYAERRYRVRRAMNFKDQRRYVMAEVTELGVIA